MKKKNGLDPRHYNYTFSEIGEELGISASAVEQISVKALEKVRTALIARGIGPTTLDEWTADAGPGLYDINDPTPVLHYGRRR